MRISLLLLLLVGIGCCNCGNGTREVRVVNDVRTKPGVETMGETMRRQRQERLNPLLQQERQQQGGW